MTARPTAAGAFKRLQDRLDYFENENRRLLKRLGERMDVHYKNGRRDGMIQGAMAGAALVVAIIVIALAFGI